MSVFWDMYGPGMAGDFQDRGGQKGVNEAKGAAREARTEVEHLERKVDMLAMICQAMWELLKEHGGVPEELLATKVQEIDLRDGKLDGKLGTRNAITCTACGRTVNKRHQRCLYCGAPRGQGGEVFERL